MITTHGDTFESLRDQRDHANRLADIAEAARVDQVRQNDLLRTELDAKTEELRKLVAEHRRIIRGLDDYVIVCDQYHEERILRADVAWKLRAIKTGRDSAYPGRAVRGIA